MRFVIVALILVAACSVMASFALAADGDVAWSVIGALIGFVSFRMAGYLEHHYGN